MINGMLVAITSFFGLSCLEVAKPQVVWDWQSKYACVGSTITTSTKVWIPSLVNIMSTCWQKKWNMVERSACNCSCPTWNLASCVMAAKVLRTTSWVPQRSLSWAQCKRWTHVTSMRCVYTHQKIPIIEKHYYKSWRFKRSNSTKVFILIRSNIHFD